MEAVIDPPARPARGRPLLYLAVVLAVLLGAFAAKLRLTGLFACPAAYGEAGYAADCSVGNYGDYDHAAFWFGLEPRAAQAARQAQVLMLGNSRLQYALSVPGTVQWFGERGIRFFTLGFAHYESITFVGPVLERLKPAPRAVVINADRFFAEWLSPVAQRVLAENDAPARAAEKRFWQRLHRPLCGTLPTLCGHAFAVYRDLRNGLWSSAGTKPDQHVPVADGPPADAAQWPHYIELAQAFVARLPVERSCIVLTIVPYSATKRAEAQAIAQALGVALVAPPGDGLTTFDGSHLDARSAAQWSAAFLQAAGPVLERCAVEH